MHGKLKQYTAIPDIKTYVNTTIKFIKYRPKPIACMPLLTALRLYFLFVGKGREKQIIISNDLLMLALARSYADQSKSI
jgi:hypothetical protein